jgi:predicted nucleic acid-binding protein
MIFLDSSALVKCYIEEVGSDGVRQLMEQEEVVTVSRLAYAETLAAIIRRRKSLVATDQEFTTLLAAFRSDWELLHIVEVYGDALQFVDEVLEKYALRGADSIHLSTAIWLKQATKAPITFVAADNELLKAAKKARLKTLNPNDYPDGKAVHL